MSSISVKMPYRPIVHGFWLKSEKFDFGKKAIEHLKGSRMAAL